MKSRRQSSARENTTKRSARFSDNNLLAERLRERNVIQLHEKLSDREFQILCRFGEGKTVRQIAEALSLSAPTVSTYRARILDKMDMRTTAQLVRYAIENGLVKPK